MIHSVRVRNFKCFRDERIEFRKLTITAGLNGVGKSSLVQALLLAQHAGELQIGRDVLLNGPYDLQLGTVSDVLCHWGDAEAGIRIDLSTATDESLSWHLVEREGEPFVLHLNEAPPGFRPFDLTYVGAERLGPRDTLEVDLDAVRTLKVGSSGEYTAQVLAAHDLDAVREEARHPRTEDAGNVVQLKKQVELWLSDFTPNVEVQALAYPGTNISAMRLRRANLNAEWLRPPNVGFGISYVLPIIVGGLLCKPDSVLIVENPEAHLHPAGQSRMGGFLARLAAAGVQVIVETHSDHVLNGVLLACASVSHPLQHSEATILYFGDDFRAQGRIETIEVTSQGGLSAWPKGFFDQSEKDLAAIIEARQHAR